MGVGTDGVDVEEIRHAEFADTKFEAAAREFVEEGEKAALVFYFVVAKGEDFMENAAAEIGRFAEGGVANDIEVGVAGKTKALREGGAAGFFDVGEKFNGIGQADAGVER